jgi:hypothetical protein
MGRIKNSSNENLEPNVVNYTKENDNNREQNEQSKESPISEMSLWSKVCFGLAGAPYQMLFVSIGLFSNVYLLETVKLPPEKTLYNILGFCIIDAQAFFLI